MVAVTEPADSARTQTAEVRVCDICGRPVAARDKSEYTAARAALVVERGLCICLERAPVPGPSLI